MAQCQSVSTFESEVRNSLSSLEPHSMDSLGHQHYAKKLNPKIALHFKVLSESKTMLPYMYIIQGSYTNGKGRLDEEWGRAPLLLEECLFWGVSNMPHQMEELSHKGLLICKFIKIVRIRHIKCKTIRNSFFYLYF